MKLYRVKRKADKFGEMQIILLNRLFFKGEKGGGGGGGVKTNFHLVESSRFLVVQ